MNIFLIFLQASSNHRLNNSQTASSQLKPQAENEKNRAISRIFPVKKSTPNSRNGHSPAPTTPTPTSTGGKSVPQVKVEVKTEPTPPRLQNPSPRLQNPSPLRMNPIPKRLDGRPILMCRIPLRWGFNKKIVIFYENWKFELTINQSFSKIWQIF